jgi:hypothetical protein
VTIAWRSSTYVPAYALIARRGPMRRRTAVSTPARIIRVPAAGSQPKVKVVEASGLPLAPSTSRPGQPNATVQGDSASADLTGPRFAIEKMTMMMRYGA